MKSELLSDATAPLGCLGNSTAATAAIKIFSIDSKVAKN